VDPNIISVIILLNIKCNIKYCLNLSDNFERYNIIYIILILIFIKIVIRERS
jgi:hypothetical protein